MNVIKQPVILSLILISLMVTGCSRSDSPDILEFSGQTMGTWYSIKVSELPDGLDPQTVADMIKGELDGVNTKMSTYKTDSELSLFNQRSPGEPQSVSQDTYTVLQKSADIWRKSMGAFDITVGPLVNLWGFGPEGRPEHVPDKKALEQAWERVGLDALQLQQDRLELNKSKPLYLDLSAIAKGYAVDKVALGLERLGVQRYLIEVGGELRAGNSKAPGRSWQVAVEEPETTLRKIHKVIALDNVSMATSGDYRNFFEEGGKRYSHTIDPRTGYPIQHNLVSVSVILPECADADAWATAMMVLGPEEGMAVAEANHIPIYMILKTSEGFEVRHSTAFARYLPG